MNFDPVVEPGPQASAGFGSQTRDDGLAYAIRGHEIQFIDVELDPSESLIAAPGSLMYKTPSVEMDTILGDGSEEHSGFLGALKGAGKRLISGGSLFSTVFTQNGPGKGRVAFAAPYPGAIIPIKLSDVKGELICQKQSFLCASKGVSIGIRFQRRIMTGLFGGEGFIMQRLSGDGVVFIHAGGALQTVTLGVGESLHVDTGCLAAMTGDVTFDIQTVRGIKSALFGGEGLFFAHLTGPGHVWLQSLPFARLAGEVASLMPRARSSASD